MLCSIGGVDFLSLPLLIIALAWLARLKWQRDRIRLLARFLAPYGIEKNMESVQQGYMRALGETDPARQEQVWYVLRGTEQELCRQVSQLAADMAMAEPPAMRVSRLPIWLPFALTLGPVFDMREAVAVHARGICRAVEADGGVPARDRAFTISAELLLLQHTCHWFCRSKAVASARMLARHATGYDKLVASVLPQTRTEYLALVG